VKNKLVLFYLSVLILAIVAIIGVLQVGAELPTPASTVAAVETTAVAPHINDDWSFTAVLSQPLSLLFMQLLIIIAASQLLGRAFNYIGQPSVIGEMAAGIVLGPSVLGLLAPSVLSFVFPTDSLQVLKLLSQIGVCLFMFTVGMELDLKQVRQKAHVAVAVSHASIVVPFLCGVLLAYFIYTEFAAPSSSFTAFALFMGISMSITAFPVLARILQERGIAKTQLGSTALTSAAIDDITAWSMLAFVVAIARASSLKGSVISVVLVICFILLMCLCVRRLLPGLFAVEKTTERELSKSVLARVLFMVVAAALFTEIIGIHAIFGAFLAGAIMPEAHDFRHKLNLRIENFSAVLLLPLFFAFTGLRTQLGLLTDLDDWILCLLIIGIASAGKIGSSAVAARIGGMSWCESLQLGALMNTRGLMELIALNIGYDLGILSPRIFTMLVIMALVTTILTGPLLTLFGMSQRQPRRT